jgi:sugar lactone lactonase YvrE
LFLQADGMTIDRDGNIWVTDGQIHRPVEAVRPAERIYIDKNDTIYVVDSQSNAMLNPGFKRGLRVGSAKDGKVTAFIPFVEPDSDKNANAGMEGVTADAMGNIYVGETSTMMLKKFVRASTSN